MRFDVRAIVAIGALLAAAAAQAAWRKVETPAFVVYSEGRPEELTRLAGDLHEFDRLLRLLTKTSAPPSPTRLRIFLVGNYAEMRRIAPMSRDIGGFYAASPHGIIAVARRRIGAVGGVDDILFHEYVHHFTYQYFPAAYPPWYVEGFAEYLATAQFTADGVEVGRFNEGRLAPLQFQKWLPWELVLAPSWRGAPDTFGLLYPQSWLATHYFNRDPTRKQQLREYLRLVAEGTPTLAALTKATGQSPDEFGKAVNGYFATRKLSYDRIRRPREPAAIRVEPLPPVESALLIDVATLAAGGLDRDEDETDDAEGREARNWRKRNLDGLRERALRFAGDPFADLLRAEAEIRVGDRAAGRALVDARLAAAPRDAQALYLKGLALALDADAGAASPETMRQARLALTAANKARPDDFRILAAYARVQPRPLSAAARDVLLRAHELAPQVKPLAFVAATALIEAGEPAVARRLLVPIATAPHRTSLAERAQAALDALNKAAPPPAPKGS